MLMVSLYDLEDKGQKINFAFNNVFLLMFKLSGGQCSRKKPFSTSSFRNISLALSEMMRWKVDYKAIHAANDARNK